MSKKILSLALVVVMLMSMFAFSTSAADLTTGQIGIKVVSDAKVGAPAGTVVTVKVYYMIPEGEEVQLTYGNLHLAYDSSTFSIDTSDATTEGNFAWGEYYSPVFKLQASTVNAAATATNNIFKAISTEEATANGWNAGVLIQESLDMNNGYTTKTGFAANPDCELFSIQFTALTEIGAEDVIGIATSAYNSNYFKLKAFSSTTTAGAAYDVANVVFTDTVAAPAAEVKVEHWDTMGQMGNWANLTGKFNGGLVGKISNLDLAFDGNECTNLLKIEVALTTATGSSKAEAYQVYEQADGSYLFRAVIKDMDITSEANISAVYTIYVDTDNNGEADKTYSSEAVNVNAKAIYEEALGEYQKTL